jgi:hypothetical protein
MKPVSEMTNSEIDTELALRGWNTVDDGGWWTGFKTHWHPTESLDQCHEIEEEKLSGPFRFEKYEQFNYSLGDNWRDLVPPSTPPPAKNPKPC